MSEAASPGNDRLMLALLVAATLHVLAIFGVSFESLRPQNPAYQVEVTLVQTPGRRPDFAEHIAQANQLGSGSEAQRELASGEQAVMPELRQTSAESVTIDESGRNRLAIPAIRSTHSEQKVVDRRGAQATREDLPESEQELYRLNQKLARLEADLDVQRDQSSSRPRIRRLDAVSARAAVDAAYLEDWRRRVEAVGNRYYPEASLRYGIFGSLKMLVTIRSNGSLEDIRILSTSGYAVLDESAIRIVRTAAPFLPFPEELRRTTDKLEIVRTWQFEQNPLSSN